jgi:hypothetical protein
LFGRVTYDRIITFVALLLINGCLYIYAEVFLFHFICTEEEDNLLLGINSFRHSSNLPALSKNDKADCLADEIADELEGEPCSSSTNGASIVPSTATILPDLPKHLKKCKINVNSTAEGIILPVCVPKLIPTLVLTNYTHSPYAKYVNSSKYTGVGVGSEDDWMVVVLSTDTVGGSFAGAVSLVSKVGLGHCLVSLWLFFVLVG